MSPRLAAAKGLSSIRASQLPRSWRLRLPLLPAISQAAGFSTSPRNRFDARIQEDGSSRWKLFAEQQKDQSSSNLSSPVDPNDWLVSPESEDHPNDTIILHSTGQRLVLNHHVLRDACECDKCVDPHSGQKNFGTTDLPDTLSVLSSERLADASLQVTWGNDFLSSGKPHISRYSAQVVRSWFTHSREDYPRLPVPTLWDKDIFKAGSSLVKYDDWVSGGPGFHAALAQLWSYGLVFIDGVPRSEDSVVTVANQVGHVHETFYGRTWDVRSKPQAENVAYTNTFLGLHQDLLYVRDPPRLQFLHCLENTCEGGDSIFSDSHRAAKLMELGPQNQVSALSNRQLRYHYKKDGHFYEQLRAVFDKKNDEVWWSPPFQSPSQPIEMSPDSSQNYAIWLAAAKSFRKLLENETWLYEYKLKPGQCVIFDNLRVLHGRRGFDTSAGSRWLKGTYVSRDEWKSKAFGLAREITAASEKDIPNLSTQARALNSRHIVW